MTTITNPYPSTTPKAARDIGESHSATILLAPLMVMTAGTGGLMTINSAAKMSDYCWVNHNIIHIENPRSVSEKIDTRSTAEHIANIRDVFAINMSDLAAVLTATRPTVYSWLEGQEPKKPETVKHIQKLSSFADMFGQANIKRLDNLLQRPILDGRSLLDILKANEDPLVALPLLKKIGEKEAQTRRKSKGSGKNLRSLDDVLSDSSVAINLEG
jgi:DNA-binding transcriptional regulator YiaG